jgi:hypothetical protein
MNIPNLPTDNLYKFSAIFGLVLIVLSSFMVSQTIDNAYQFEDNLNSKIAFYELDSLGIQNIDSINIAKSRVQIEKDYKQYNRIIRKLPSLYYLYFVLLILGSISTLIGFLNWYFKTQKLNDYILKIESEKIKNNKAVLVHKIQFEEEFKVYKELWPELIKLSIVTQQLRPIIELKDANKSDEELRIMKGDEFNKTFKKCVIVFQENKPFYPEDIFNEVDNIIKISRKEVIEWKHMPSKESTYYINAEKNMAEIIAKIDNVCLMIRDRIGILKIKS